MKIYLTLFLLISSLFPPATAYSWYPRPMGDSIVAEDNLAPIVGRNMPFVIGKDDTLVELAYRSGIGYLSLTRANPGVDPWLPPQGKTIILPYSAILPTKPKPGIVINLAEFRLYYFWKEGGHFRARIYPIGIGQEGWDTPLGNFSVISKAKDPVWVVPESIQKERPDQPTVVPPGPDNPLGGYWIGLSAKGYGIHGTSKPLGVGRRVSHGCIRLYPKDIRDLFSRVAQGTPVTITYQPAKVGVRDNKLWVEIHPNERDETASVANVILKYKALLEWPEKINWPMVWREIDNPSGIPLVISRGKDPQ
ncbi:MAG: L,D-transpeptidase family protein [Deltaproteobacteria bacterium]|nr:L,D-transpeptidase family protein [Deltaproteobacteria bacterium]